MDIQQIIEVLKTKGVITTTEVDYQCLSGGTVSRLYLLLNTDGTSYVVKINVPQVLKSEVTFLEHYKDIHLLPKLLYVDASYRFIIYSYILGTSFFGDVEKKEVVVTLAKEFINRYKRVPSVTGWGWADAPTDSWQAFLTTEVFEASEIIGENLGKEDINYIERLVQQQNRYIAITPYLLHGDCGVHNFIFNKGRLCGVIDPTPIIGPPIFDLISAFCSSPEDLSKETFDVAIGELQLEYTIPTQILYEDLMIGLYIRLGRCIKHHPNDFQKYLDAWGYWKNILRNQ
ncbi:aminoglycoside phosphotransferase family protein [Fredinandcohnia humi]